MSNQSLSPDEDAQNKPWRPIPSQRLTVHQAIFLRWTLLPLCLALSIANGVSALGTVLMIGILLHNELRLDAHWFTRNVLNAIGYATFDAGAMTIAHSGTWGTTRRLLFASTVTDGHNLQLAVVFRFPLRPSLPTTRASPSF